MQFFQMIVKGGPVMWPILFAGVVGLFVFLLKAIQFHREEINVSELVKGLKNVLKRDGLIEAISLCDNTSGPVAKVVGAAILAFERGDEDLRQAADEAYLQELPKLDLAFLPKNLPYTMTDEEFIQAANLIKPKRLYCYHYFEIDIPKLKKELDPAIELLN